MMKKKINLVVADMGYGHQRAAYPLLYLSSNEVITINDYPGISEEDKNYWVKNLEAYEKVSRFKKVPLFGKAVFATMDFFQKIQPFYPFRDLSKPTIQQIYFLKLIQNGLGKDLIEKLNFSGLPFVTTFFVAAYMAEMHSYQGDIYCVVCDADVSRAWAPVNSKNSRVKFFVPSERVKKRLMMYGVKDKNIFITGFPLPQENVGIKKQVLITDLARRIVNLDPKNIYRTTERALVKANVPLSLKKVKSKTVTITFAVGGAGAQKEVGSDILKSVAGKIKSKKIILNLVAGNRQEVAEYFKQEISLNGLRDGDGVKIIFHKDKMKYFSLFNKALRTTDILWTKPSELSLFSGLGLPIIMSNPVGSQEDFNREWLLSVGAGIDSHDPLYVDEWLDDLLNSGRLARAAMAGFLNVPSQGAYNIEKIISNK